MKNLINLSDSYKFSHFNQYPKGTEIIHSYLAPRGGEYEKVVMHGLPYILKEYLSKPNLWANTVSESEQLAKAHGVPFNREGWEYVEKLRYLPIEIKALPEGTIVGNKEPLLTIENTDPNCAWLVGYLETLLLKIWYPVTVASKSYHVRQILERFWKPTGSIAGVDFAYHNFGDRGSSSVESAAIGGVAHLTQFKGTDNFNALTLSNEYYDGKYQGYSIPASEHSTVTSWGQENEFEMIKAYLKSYKNSSFGLIACVLDSYNIWKATDFVTSGEMKAKIESADYPIFVIRPDSGVPEVVIEKILGIMANNEVAYEINLNNNKKVFKKYRIIWGDGITPQTIAKILTLGNSLGYSPENFAFGSGGDLMQNVNRDTCKFAMKCSAIKVNGEWRDVYKDPITDQGKASIRGKVEDSRFVTVFKNGEILI
jgi:nicotinamide phosphoribosyltransferase